MQRSFLWLSLQFQELSLDSWNFPDDSAKSSDDGFQFLKMFFIFELRQNSWFLVSANERFAFSDAGKKSSGGECLLKLSPIRAITVQAWSFRISYSCSNKKRENPGCDLFLSVDWWFA